WIDEVEARHVTVESIDDLLVTHEFQVDAPTTIAGLYGNINGANLRPGGCLKGVGSLCIARGRFESNAKGNVSIPRFGRVEQPRIRHQPQVAQTARSRGLASSKVEAGVFPVNKR